MRWNLAACSVSRGIFSNAAIFHGTDAILDREVSWRKSNGADAGPAPAPDEVRAHLEAVLASRRFEHSGVQGVLLRHLVERTLAGDRAALEEASIAAAVFGRPERFDPISDPVVRLVTPRLRRRLRQYYASRGGRRERLRIVLRRGSYAPLIERRRGAARRWSMALLLALAIACVACLALFLPRREPRVAVHESLAVLPFENAVEASDAGYYGRGVAGDLAAGLSGEGGPRVTAPFSTGQLGGQPAGAREAARRLGVDAVLTGRVYPRDGRARISVELVDGAGRRLWSGTYEAADAQLAAVEGGIARAAARASGFSLGSAAAPAHFPGVVAREDFWRGRALLAQGFDHRFEAREYLRRATALDAGYAEAWALLGRVCAQMALQFDGPREELTQQAAEAARRAIALDERQADAHAALAAPLFYFDRDWAGAEREMLRALALNPSDIWARRLYAAYLAARGRFEESTREIETARRIDPLSFEVARDMAIVYYYARRYDAAVAAARSIPRTDPAYAWSRPLFGSALALDGNLGEAEAALRDAALPSDGNPAALGRLSAVLAVQGKRGEAIRLADEAAASDAVSAQRVHAAYGYAALGLPKPAVDALQAAYDRKDPDLVFAAVEPLFDSLREDPGFQELLGKLGW